MSSSDLLRLGIVRETTPGVTPANPAFQLLRVTAESLAFTPDTQQSNELNPARQLTDIIVAGGQSGGDVTYELSSNPGLELLLEGALGNSWSADVLTVGALLFTHTLEKRFTLNEATGDYEFNRFVRAVVDSMTITCPPGGAATGTATFVGGQMSRGSADLTGASYLDAGKLPVMIGSGVLPIAFTIGGTTFTAWCLSNLVVNFRNNARAILCLGQEFAGEVVLGRFECELSADIYINTDTDLLMDAFVGKEEIALAFTVTDSLGNAYEFAFTRVRVATATEVAAGTNQDVILSVTLQALVDDITVPAITSTCVTITRTHVSSPWPALTTTDLREAREAAKAPRESSSQEVAA